MSEVERDRKGTIRWGRGGARKRPTEWDGEKVKKKGADPSSYINCIGRVPAALCIRDHCMKSEMEIEKEKEHLPCTPHLSHFTVFIKCPKRLAHLCILSPPCALCVAR